MSAHAHTPGPWAVGAEVASARFGGPSIRGGGATVAVVISGNGRADANAALIAAAPDLLAALRRSVEAMAARMPHCSVLPDARAAIDKAEGRP